VRESLPDDRPSKVIRGTFKGARIYIALGFYPPTYPPFAEVKPVPTGQFDADGEAIFEQLITPHPLAGQPHGRAGQLGEVFISVDGGKNDVISRKVALLGPFLDQWAIAASIAFQWGESPDHFLRKFYATKFEPAGDTGDEQIPRCSSLHDFLARKIALALSIDLGVGDIEREARRIEREAAASSPASSPGVAPAAFVRCPGDGKHGCGHDPHDGPCRANAFGMHRCACTGRMGATP
jgi:hypothetical protein